MAAVGNLCVLSRRGPTFLHQRIEEMLFGNHLNFNHLGLVAALAGLLAAGCGGGPSAEQALNRAMADAGKVKGAVYPLAGKVTIDSQAPQFDKPSYRLVVVLNDPDKPDVPAIQRPHVEVNKEGEFAFSTYGRGDGVKPGKYVLTFAVFQHKMKLGYIPPDQLHNLYSDPDANAKNPEFVIDHKAPGKRDYNFNLQVAGKAPAEPGPHALNGLMDEGDPGANKYHGKR
jgi:hypothetical protein